MGKYKTFSVPIKNKIINIDKDGNETAETISYKIKFVDSGRFMAISLSNIVDDLTDRIHKIKCKNCGSFFEYESLKDNSIKYKCLSCNTNYSKKLNEELEKQCKKIFNFYNNDINKFVFLLRKDVYPYEYMDDWEKFNKTTLPEKEEFYSNLNMEEITDVDYTHRKRVCKDFEIKNLGEHHDLYLNSDPLLLADVFEIFRKMCLEIYELDPTKFLSAPGLLNGMQRLIINILKIIIKNHHILIIGM